MRLLLTIILQLGLTIVQSETQIGPQTNTVMHMPLMYDDQSIFFINKIKIYHSSL